MGEGDIGVIEWLFKIGCGAFAIIVGWLWTGVSDQMKSLKKEIESTDDRITMSNEHHAEHRVYVEKEFEKKDTIQMSLGRIHDRLDKLFEVVKDKNE